MNWSASKVIFILVASVLFIMDASVVLWVMNNLAAYSAAAAGKLHWSYAALFTALIVAFIFGLSSCSERRRSIMGNAVSGFFTKHFRGICIAVFIATMTPFAIYLTWFAENPFAVVQDVFFVGLTVGFCIVFTLVFGFVGIAITEARPK